MYPDKKEDQGYDPLQDGPDLGHPLPEKQTQIHTPDEPVQGTDILGFQQPFKRIAAGLVTLALVVVVVLVLRVFTGEQTKAAMQQAVRGQPGITPTVTLSGPAPVIQEVKEVEYSGGIPRLAQLHTNLPSRPRDAVSIYTVVAGDTVIGIAKKFGLKPETIMWGNYYTLLDNPTMLQENQELNILPVDGVYHKWSAGEGLNGVAAFYHVDPQTIVDFPGNNLDPETLGDYSNPKIEPDTWIIIPGGKREYIDWSMAGAVNYATSATGEQVATSCGYVTGGAVGLGYFVWPTNNHFLSGYDYSPEINHYGIDLDGNTGDPIYASDSGVVVFAGWNEYGYGNEIIIDHGNGWKTLYAHLSQISVECGGSVGNGQLIGLMGSTGNSSGSHLHFEMINQSTKVNPHSYLPAP